MQKEHVLNMAIANGNLMVAIMKDDAPEILKAVNQLRRAQVLCECQLYTGEQLDGMEAMARKRVDERFAAYGVPGNA